MEHRRAGQMRGKEVVFQRRHSQADIRSLRIPRPFAAERLMSTSGPGTVPTRIIACGKNNLDKLYALCSYIKQSGSSRFSIWFFCCWAPSL